MPPEAWGPGPPTPPATPDATPFRVPPFAVRDADVKKMSRAAAFDARREIDSIKTFIQTRMAAGHGERAVRRALQAMQAEMMARAAAITDALVWMEEQAEIAELEEAQAKVPAPPPPYVDKAPGYDVPSAPEPAPAPVPITAPQIVITPPAPTAEGQQVPARVSAHAHAEDEFVRASAMREVEARLADMEIRERAMERRLGARASDPRFAKLREEVEMIKDRVAEMAAKEKKRRWGRSRRP
ncbi:uncharacterized protein LOC62_05G007707 [Vanrija pseudolonga]|uniref:Uncharacterized protein n=1 Tax=Vanrija pseudolonga TaxID=143232 RepID=A0AAF0YD15_9TREE|nr:hypothetical protein LOC62_05G007707 [Vanrija pseudolonga]